VVIIPPGFLVNVQVPAAGKPFKTTLPVGTAHVGCVIVPIPRVPLTVAETQFTDKYSFRLSSNTPLTVGMSLNETIPVQDFITVNCKFNIVRGVVKLALGVFTKVIFVIIPPG